MDNLNVVLSVMPISKTVAVMNDPVGPELGDRNTDTDAIKNDVT